MLSSSVLLDQHPPSSVEVFSDRQVHSDVTGEQRLEPCAVICDPPIQGYFFNGTNVSAS